MSRDKVVRATYFAFMLPAATAGAALGVFALVSLGVLHLNQQHLSGSGFLVLLGTLLVTFFAGGSTGGWLWSRFAKRFLGVTREEMRALLLSKSYQVGFIDRANERAINKLYGGRVEG